MKKKKEKEITEGKIHSPSGSFAERAKKSQIKINLVQIICWPC